MDDTLLPILAVVDVRQFRHRPVLGPGDRDVTVEHQRCVGAVAQDKLMFELAVAELLALGRIRVRVEEDAPTS